MSIPYVSSSQFDWYISPTDRMRYESEFESATALVGQYLPKPLAFQLFLKIRRPPAEFDAIWTIISREESSTPSLSSATSLSSLNLPRFVIFMHLVNSRRNNRPLPTRISPEIANTFNLSSSSLASTRASPRRSMSVSASSLVDDQSTLCSDMEKEITWLENYLSALGELSDIVSELREEKSLLFNNATTETSK